MVVVVVKRTSENTLAFFFFAVAPNFLFLLLSFYLASNCTTRLVRFL